MDFCDGLVIARGGCSHSTPSSIAVMRRSARGGGIINAGIGQIALRVEFRSLLEMLIIIMRAISIHVETRALGNNRIAPFDIANTLARQADGNDGPEAEGLLDEGGDVGDFFFHQAALPGVVVGVDFVDFRKGLGLDVLTARRGEVGYAHD